MNFPFADAPDIIRAHQKDTFVEVRLRDGIKELVQWFKGVRVLNALGPEIDAGSTFLYLCLTTLLSSRTLGEEYTDLVYLTPKRQLPSVRRRAGYVLLAGIFPILIFRHYGKVKRRILARLAENSLLYSIVDNLNLSTLATVNLAVFYFSGSYYTLSKRAFGMRYAFGHRVNPLEVKGSYEFLGLLMVLQGLVKLANTLRARYGKIELEKSAAVEELTLGDPKVLPFIPTESRMCNLCLEDIRSPTVTLCGHMFCWSCIAGWCRDKSECPLCRQSCDEQNLLKLQP